MKELTLGAATFALAVFAMQSVAQAQTPSPSTTVSPAPSVTTTTTPTPSGEVKGVTVPGGAPSTGFGGR